MSKYITKEYSENGREKTTAKDVIELLDNEALIAKRFDQTKLNPKPYGDKTMNPTSHKAPHSDSQGNNAGIELFTEMKVLVKQLAEIRDDLLELITRPPASPPPRKKTNWEEIQKLAYESKKNNIVKRISGWIEKNPDKKDDLLAVSKGAKSTITTVVKLRQEGLI